MAVVGAKGSSASDAGCGDMLSGAAAALDEAEAEDPVTPGFEWPPVA